MFDIALRAEGFDPVLNLALEESLLERGIGREGSQRGAILVYVNDPCVVVGRNQNPWAEVASDAGYPVLRRVSGGGAVYHDRGNLNWSIITPRSLHDSAAELEFVARAISKLGVSTFAGPRGGLFVAEEGPWKGAKLSGTARRLSAARVLHHGTLLVDADLEKLSLCLGGLATSRSKALPSVPSASVNLASLVPGLRVEEAAAAILGELSRAPERGAEALADRGYLDAAASRLSSWDWTWGSTPAFFLELPWMEGTVELEIREGRLAAASGQGAERLSALVGRRFDYGLPDLAMAALTQPGEASYAARESGHVQPFLPVNAPTGALYAARESGHVQPFLPVNAPTGALGGRDRQ
jgi:lipoate---protein ligase